MKKVTEAQMTEEAEVSIQYRFLEARRSASTIPEEAVKCPVSMYLGEAIRTTPENAFLPFTVALEGKPGIVSFRIKGEVFVKGPSQTVQRQVLPINGRPPRIWSQVYRDILDIASKLAEHLNVTIPLELYLNET